MSFALRAIHVALLTVAVPTLALHSRAITTLESEGPPHSKYYWPEPRGQHGFYSTSPFTAPRRLGNKLAWSWTDPEFKHNKYAGPAPSGLVMDDKKNIYLSTTNGIRKLSPQGKQLWVYKVPTWRIPCLMDGALYGSGNNGTAFALDMETGRPIWKAKFTEKLGMDISGVGAKDGVVVLESHGESMGGASHVAGLNATNGRTLWEIKTESQLWNFMPMFTSNGSVVFQDQIGGVYHVNLKDGKQIWKAGYKGGWAAHFTDGLTMLGSNDVVYTVHSEGKQILDDQPATFTAYRLKDGHALWRKKYSHPLNSQAVVGHIGNGTGLSKRLVVVVPVGAQPLGDFKKLGQWHSGIEALDAETGELIWEVKFHDYHYNFVAGDVQRILSGTVCLPNPYGSPTIDASGTVFIGHFDGKIYSIRDDNGDGKINIKTELSSYNTGAGFSHGGAVIAPGMLAIASCDTLYVFKE